MPRLRVAAPAVVLLMVAMAACTSGNDGDETPARDASQALELNVMEFNIEYGGNNVAASVIEAIRAADADVVAIEEAYAKMPRIAAELGWPYYDAGLQLVSRFPLLAPPESDGLYTFVAVRPGRVVAIGNVHLPSTRYGPFQIERNDAKPGEVMEIERNLRLPALEPTLDAVSALAAQGMPVFLAGDFNAYSQEDPIQVLEAAGYTRLESDTADEWSYSFDGMSDSLDHVLANDAALADVTGVDTWEINANEAVAFEYSRFNQNVTQLYERDVFRASDHNPELVGLRID